MKEEKDSFINYNTNITTMASLEVDRPPIVKSNCEKAWRSEISFVYLRGKVARLKRL